MPAAASPSHSRASRIVAFLTKRLALPVDELIAVRDAIDAHIRQRAGIDAQQSGPRRTLYLPHDPLDDL